MLVGMVDCVFADVAQPDQARIVALNSQYFLKAGGGFVVSIKARASTTATRRPVFAAEVATPVGPVQAQGASWTLGARGATTRSSWACTGRPARLPR